MKGKPRVYVRMLLSYMGRLVIPTAGAVSELEESLCREAGTKMLMALEEKHRDWNPERDSILQGGTGAYGRAEVTHIPIICGDYFFVEGILRLLGKGFIIW